MFNVLFMNICENMQACRKEKEEIDTIDVNVFYFAKFT